MSPSLVVKSACELCNQGCGVLIRVEDGRPVGIKGDPNDPVSRGAICVKGQASLDYLNHPNRLKHPLKRIGEKGKGEWHTIGWDEAFEDIASKLGEIKTKYGPESIAFMRGAAKGYQDAYMGRFANAFGSPNITSMAPLCFVSRANAYMLTYGDMVFPDYENPPALILLWAINTHNTAAGEWKRTTEAVKKGSELIVIDPWKSESARMAEVWIKPRPCSDLALALGMLNVILKEELYDHDFVEKWTVGFDRLKEHVGAYPPEKVAEITWVPADTIARVAHTYAEAKSACLVLGNGTDNNINNLQTARAVSILRAVTGNVGRPGGDLQWSSSGALPRGSPDLNAQDALPPQVRARRLNAGDALLPIAYYSLPQTVMAAILTGKPYPIRAVFVQGANLLQTLPNSNETYRALQKVEYLVVSDLFMTPTAELADIVLPVASYLEVDSLHEGEYTRAANVIQKVASVGECLSDYEIYAGLARRMGLERYFSKTSEEMLDYILAPTGLTFAEFRKRGAVAGVRQPRLHEKVGFNTPSKKVELYSSTLAEWGFDPLPVYHEPPESPMSDPDLTRKYPFVLTNHKSAFFQHSGERMINRLRRSHPEPVVHIQADTARRMDIHEGDWVSIETMRGKIRQKADLVADMDPRVVIADYGWWFPEKDAVSLHGWAESNLNILTYSGRPWGREMGTPTLRGIVCNVAKLREQVG
jgi:anaerobic selenocysteine-containing dehydrogenase